MDFLVEHGMKQVAGIFCAFEAHLGVIAGRHTMGVVSSMGLQHALWCSFFESIKI